MRQITLNCFSAVRLLLHILTRTATAGLLLALLTLYAASFTTIKWRIANDTAAIAQNGIVWCCHANWPLFHYGVSAPDRGLAPQWWPSDGRFYTRTSRTRAVEFPIWMPTLIALACFCITWRPVGRSLIARRRSRRGFCGSCRYDLRAHESRTCPECGAPVAAKLPPP